MGPRLTAGRPSYRAHHVTSILRAFGFRELALSGFLRQFFNALLQLRIGPKNR
jgi:hypothetical protein